MLVKLLIYFAVLLNPFSQVLYLWNVMDQFDWREFARIYARASILSYLVYGLFVLSGEFLIVDVFQVRLDAMRIFGGLIILTVGYRYIVNGEGSSLLFRGKAEDLAPEISLPYMIGPGTIWVSILIGRTDQYVLGLGGIALLLVLNFWGVALIHLMIHVLTARGEAALSKYLGILMRLNALFIGAIGVEMILTGIDGAIHSVATLPGPGG